MPTETTGQRIVREFFEGGVGCVCAICLSTVAERIDAALAEAIQVTRLEEIQIALDTNGPAMEELKEAQRDTERYRMALLRNRQGYVNILEMRKLSSEQWGQRDGYGGRYGALTREEIEEVISQIDQALQPIDAARAKAEERP